MPEATHELIEDQIENLKKLNYQLQEQLVGLENVIYELIEWLEDEQGPPPNKLINDLVDKYNVYKHRQKELFIEQQTTIGQEQQTGKEA